MIWWRGRLCSTGEDYIGYLSARSHFSDDKEISIPASDKEVADIISEAEVQRLNTKIDRLIAALTSGRHIHFEHNPVAISLRLDLSASIRN